MESGYGYKTQIIAKVVGATLSEFFLHFWATVCKTVRPMLLDRCLSCLSVCNVGVL